MVDFNNETTVGIPATDVERISILQRRYDLIEAFEDYKKKRLNNAGVSINIVQARTISLFLELQPTFKRKFKTEEYEKFKTDIFTLTDEETFLEVFCKINELLDDIKLIRIDTQRVYNDRIVEEENEAKGL